jgi:hypothetical protein
MRLFVLVVLAAGMFYPVARQPSLRFFAFSGLIALYAGAGAVLWNEHRCHFAEGQSSGWTLASLAGASHDITCDAIPAVGNRFLTTAAYTP